MAHRSREPANPAEGEASTRPDAGWFEEEVVRLLPDLMEGARALAASEDEAEDMVAQAVARGWTRLDDLRDRARLRGWLFCILRNAFLSRKRKERARPAQVPLPQEGGTASDDPADPREGGFSLFEQLHAPFLLWSDNPEKRFLDGLLREDLARALDALPEPYGAVVRLVDVRGFRYAEVAEALEIPVGTVRSRLARGRSLLQSHLWEHAVDRGLRPDDPPPGAHPT